MVEETFKYAVPIGMNSHKVEQLLHEFEAALGKRVNIKFEDNFLYLQCYDGVVPSYVKFEKFNNIDNNKLIVPIGYGNRGLVTFNFSSDQHCYMLVGGVPGSGKSNFINQLSHTLLTNHTEDDVKFVLIDLKLGVELEGFFDNPHVWQSCIDPEDTDKVFQVLGNLNSEVRERMDLFRQVGVKNISEYRSLGYKLPYLFLIIDEYAFIHDIKRYDKSKHDYETAELQLKRILQIGRAAGLRAIISTQRPTKDCLSTTVKALMTDRLCFKVVDEDNSRVILDKAGAERLPNIAGRALFSSGFEIREIQVMDFSI